jgi:dTDP-4-amino-4,6-dideoxygalactose transaminase
MKFLDTAAEYKMYKKRIDEIVYQTALNGKYLLGKNTEKLESEFKKITKTDQNIAVKNCTDAITMIVKKHWRKGMPIIIPNFGAYPTSVAVHSITDNVHYVDVDNTFTMDTNKLPDLKNGIIIPVHLFGNNCDMSKIMEYANLNNHIVIEDCAQSTGSGSGVHGDYSVFSFYPTKPLASMGDGGLICTRMGDADYFRKFRFYGQLGRNMEFVGINSRMDEFQAGIVLSKIDDFNDLNKKRREIACIYSEFITGMNARDICVYHQFPIMLSNRGKAILNLKTKSIPYIIHYEKHVTDFSFLNKHQYKTSYRINENILSLPVHPFMSNEDIDKVCKFLKEVSNDEIT